MKKRSMCGLRDPSVWKHMWVSEMPMLTEESWSTRLRRPFPAILVYHSFQIQYCFTQQNSVTLTFLEHCALQFVLRNLVFMERQLSVFAMLTAITPSSWKKLKRFRFLSLLLFYWCTHDIGLVTISMCSFLWPINTLAHRVRNYRCDQRHWIARIP